MIEMGKKYRIREGSPIRILAVDLDVKHPVVGYLSKFGVLFFNKDGTYSSGKQSSYDLIEVHPLEGVPVDTPIWIRDSLAGGWVPRHFARICKETGNVFTWANGTTSHSKDDPALCKGNATTSWAEYSLTKP